MSSNAPPPPAQDSFPGAPLKSGTTATKPPQIYHGVLLQGVAVPRLDSPPDPSDVAKSRQYGQYRPHTVEELQRMSQAPVISANMDLNAEQRMTFPVMALPPELRLKIWEFAIAGDSVDLVDWCHDEEYHYDETTDHPWYTAKCFIASYGAHIKGVANDHHKPFITPGRNLLLANKKVREEVLPLLPRRRFNVQTACFECAEIVVRICPHIKAVAFPIAASSQAIASLSSAGKPAVIHWANLVRESLLVSENNLVSKVIFWLGDKGRPSITGSQGIIYHRLELSDPEPGQETREVQWIGSL